MADIHDLNHRRPRLFRRIDRQLTDLRDEEVRRRYRFSPRSIDRLLDIIGPGLQRRTNRNRPLTPKQQLLIALRFYASGNFLQVIGDTFGVDIATVSRVVTDVTDKLFQLKDRIIKFPVNEEDLRSTRNGFYTKYGFPGVVGLIDGTHIKIIAPGQPDEPAYVNRKHQHSINVQATCNHKGMFTSINASWPGSSHDSHVFRSSNLCRHLEANHQDPEKGFLLGDMGYPCRPFLLTPYANTVNEAEEKYNRAHMRTRNQIERVFGMWKRKFHVLHSEVRMKPWKVSRIIVACAILYNLLILWNEPIDDDNDDDDDDQPPVEVFRGAMDGRRVREHITQTFFNN